MRGLAAVLAGCSIFAWVFAEWLILSLCNAYGDCTRSHYVQLQGLIAVIGMGAAFWVIWSSPNRESMQRPLLLFVCSVVAWTLVVTIQPRF
jgi:hypothetical protein